jgi:DNA gyrase subunit A
VRGIRLKNGDEVIGMNIISRRDLHPELDVLVLLENGFGKRTKAIQYKKQKRGGAGIKTAKVTQKTGNLRQVRLVNLTQTKEGVNNDLLIISQAGQVIRLPLTQVPRLGRSTQGVRVMRFKEPDDKIASATVI